MKPYAVYVPYRNRMPIMQELLRLKAAGTLEGPASLWMRDSRPPEELYDTQADPHEIHNLADDPNYQDVLTRMQRAMDGWMERIDDMGRIPESQMVRRMWPDMHQPATYPPILMPRASTAEPVDLVERAGGTFEGPMEVVVYCPTQGASIAYKMGPNVRWKLYTGPIRLTEGTTTIHAKAVRYGYKPSEKAEATFTVVDQEMANPQD